MALTPLSGTSGIVPSGDETPKLVEESLFRPPKADDLPLRVARCDDQTELAAMARDVLKTQAAMVVGMKLPGHELSNLTDVIAKMLQP